MLVLGGSGGTGSAAIQLAKAFGASRIAATASPDNFAYCRSLGATEMIDYHTVDWWDGSVFAAGEVDVVLDTVGEKGTADHAFSVLSPHGGECHWLILSAKWQPPFLSLPNLLTLPSRPLPSLLRGTHAPSANPHINPFIHRPLLGEKGTWSRSRTFRTWCCRTRSPRA